MLLMSIICCNRTQLETCAHFNQQKGLQVKTSDEQLTWIKQKIRKKGEKKQ